MRDQLAWYVAGPILGLCVVACRVLFNGRLGVTGGFSEILTRVSRRSLAFDWRGWFALGIVAGGALFLLVNGSRGWSGHGWMTRSLTGDAEFLIAPLLVVCGIAIGYGAKTSGGCTSGNGLSGTSMLSGAALTATATFFATAIAITFALEAVT
jgi:hypothetical protein